MLNPTRPPRPSFEAVDLDVALLGGTPSVSALRSAISTLGQLDTNLLLRGEAGTGKQACALALHRMGSRRGHPFFNLHLEGMGEARMHDCLFGERGVTSLSARARRATIYLDGIELLPQRLQHRLVAALNEGDAPNIRLIAGSAVHLDEHVRHGRFQRMLYDRIATLQVSLPPLRERRADVAVIATAVLERWAERTANPAKSLGEGALASLEEYDWPANVRELLCVIGVACDHTRGPVVSVDRVRSELRARPRRHVAPGIVPLKQVEREYLLSVMERCGGNQTLAARRLGIGRSTLLRHLQACGQRHLGEVSTYVGPLVGQRPLSVSPSPTRRAY